MGTRMLIQLVVGICIVGAVSAQYPYNSLYQGQEKEQGRYRPQLSPSSTTASPNDPRFAKIMKQINKVNDDGSYTFGYEADDGSFRVETRTKDGLVKGKYGFVDANGQLKVTEYTAGEKSEEPEKTAESDEEESGEVRRPPFVNNRPQPLSARPQYYGGRPHHHRQQQPQSLPSRQVVSATPAPYRVTASSSDQSTAAQTSQKVSRPPPTSDDDFRESGEDDSDSFARRQSQSQEDPLNGQYFRQSVGQRQQGPRRFPPPAAANGISAAGRPLPGPAGPYSSGAPIGGQQYQGFGGPEQYSFGPSGPQDYSQGPQSFPQGPPQFGGPSQGGVPQYSGAPQGFSPADFQGPPQGFQPGFRRQQEFQQAPQDFSSIGQQQLQGAPQSQQPAIQNFGGFGGPSSFGGFNERQGSNPGKSGNSQIPNEEHYVPSVELDGYSEDLDQDGYPDEPPKDGKLATKATTSSSGSGSPAYRPVSLGPQTVQVQGGVQRGVQPGRGQPGTQLTDEQFQQLFNQGAQQAPAARPAPQVILQLGPQGQAPGRQQLGGSPGFPGAGVQQGSPVSQQGGGHLPPQYVPQQQFGGFPQGAPQQGGFPQGFPQGPHEFDGQGFDGPQGFPQQFSSAPQSAPQGFGGSGSGGAPSRSPIQSEGFPYDFNPFQGASPYQGGPQQAFPSGPAPGPQQYQGFPVQANYPGAPQQFAGFPGGAQQGFPGGRFQAAPGGPGGVQHAPHAFGQYPGGPVHASPSPATVSSSSPAEGKKA